MFEVNPDALEWWTASASPCWLRQNLVCATSAPPPCNQSHAGWSLFSFFHMCCSAFWMTTTGTRKALESPG